jgi:cytochrome b561
VQIGLHWTIAALVLLLQVPAGITMVASGPGMLQNVCYDIHKTTGIVIFLLANGVAVLALVAPGPAAAAGHAGLRLQFVLYLTVILFRLDQIERRPTVADGPRRASVSYRNVLFLRADGAPA